MNNNRVTERDKESLSIHQKLNANRRVLKALHGVFGEQELPAGIVEKAGIDFQVNNGRILDANGVQILDYKIIKFSNNNYKIFKNA